MGTDAGTPFNAHSENLGELQRLVELGYSPMEALGSGTRIASQILCQENELGTIEEGKDEGISRLVRFDLGRSTRTQNPVREQVCPGCQTRFCRPL